MYLLAKIPYASVELRWHQPLAGAAPVRTRQLRGAIAHAFPDDNRFHQHDAEGKPLYRYPHIHYRWKGGYGIVAGWITGAETLMNVPWLELPLTIGEDKVQVMDAIISTQYAQFGISDDLRYYQFVSPTLIFNKKNYEKYKGLDSEMAKQYELDRLLVAQLLSPMRGLGVNFEVQLYAAFTHIKTTQCQLKGQTMLGIQGDFVSNALLPSGLGIGHAVSHGYGWIVPKTD
jgi:hypothetical protein